MGLSSSMLGMFLGDLTPMGTPATSAGLGSTVPEGCCWQLLPPSSMSSSQAHRTRPGVPGGTLNTWRSGDDGRPVTERLQVRF
jgi:hypothetical protein